MRRRELRSRRKNGKRIRERERPMANGKEQRRRSGKARNGSDRNIFRWFSWKRGPKRFRRSMNRMRTSRDTQEEDGAILQRTSTLRGNGESTLITVARRRRRRAHGKNATMMKRMR